MYKFWYGYVNPKYEAKPKLCYMDTASLIFLEQDIIPQIMNQKNHYLKEKNKKVIGLMKDELVREVMREVAAWRPETYSYLTDDNDGNKKRKSIKMCFIKRNLKF